MSQPLFNPLAINESFATVVIPLALQELYTYSIPPEIFLQLRFGMRVEVQFGKSKLYSGIVVDIHQNKPGYKTKDIVSIIDPIPVINEKQYKFWQWISSYYMCTVGEVMNAALPANLKLSSETILVLRQYAEVDISSLSDKEYILTEALSIQNEISISDAKKILDQKSIYGIITKLIDKGVLILKEELKNKTVKTYKNIELHDQYKDKPESLASIFDLISKSEKQTQGFMGFLALSKTTKHVLRAEVAKKANVSSAIVKTLLDKKILQIYDKNDRLLDENYDISEAALSPDQSQALKEIDAAFETKSTVLLHGITGSGKTHLYTHKIKEVIKNGGQVLYMVPEIALTTQLVKRLENIFGENISVFHSKVSNKEREILWQKTLKGVQVVLGARSSIYLPFTDLQLIIVDEEHDRSFKQNEPNPRYNARDAAIFLAHLFDAKVLLGTATPSLESYYNAKMDKYGLVELNTRYGGVSLPELSIVSLVREYKERGDQAFYSNVLVTELENRLDKKQQAILFQNRRGYAPSLKCNLCGWHQECQFCDVSMTYHSYSNDMRCHYCGHNKKMPKNCPACGNHLLQYKGLGTQKIAEELKIYVPNARIARMDYDAINTKKKHEQIVSDFEDHNIDIIVGTQMVTKGLDFDNLTLVCIVNADQLFNFPDFRASERAYQLLTQVAGRAGRRQEQGKVLIQTFSPKNPVLKFVLANDFKGFYADQIAERQSFLYPPFYRLIVIKIKHKDPKIVNSAAREYGHMLKQAFGKRIIGPAKPLIPRVRNLYQVDIMIKMEKKAESINRIKKYARELSHDIVKTKGWSSVRFIFDVDPY